MSITSKYTALFYLSADVTVALTPSSYKLNRKGTRGEQKEQAKVQWRKGGKQKEIGDRFHEEMSKN